jgi:hypothetical protein
MKVAFLMRVSVEVRCCNLFQLPGGLDLAKGASNVQTFYETDTQNHRNVPAEFSLSNRMR